MTSAETWSAYLSAVALVVVGFGARYLGAYEVAQACASVALIMFAVMFLGLCWEWFQAGRVWKARER